MLSEPRTLIIVNNVAARARRAWPVIQARLRDSNVNYTLHETRFTGDATTQTSAALKTGCQLIAVVGGDGTLSEAAAGFFELSPQAAAPLAINPEAALAILPAGTGDDFARGLMGQRAPLDHWIETMIAHCRERTEKSMRLIDVIQGRADDYQKPFICLNASTLGIGGETAARVAAQGNLIRKLAGEARFVVAAIGALAAWRERPVRVSIDDKNVIECPMNLIAVANSKYAGGGMMFSPQARIDDGILDVVTACGLTRSAVMRELPRIHTGGHVANPKVRITQGQTARIETFAPEDALPIEVDGNLRGRTPAEFRILPGALRFVVSDKV
jgi:YegS/Rv2252/BmrU family lipid kinase